MAWVVTIDRAKAPDMNADAFERLFHAEFSRVRAIAARTGLGIHEADDVAQDVFTQFYRRHPADAPYAAAWLRRAAAHLALNAIRTRKRRAIREEREALASSAINQMSSASSAPHALVEDDERRREVRTVMEKLSERHATVLALRYSGMSYIEIASAMGIPAAHVGTLLRRAEASFKKEFEHGSSR